VGILVVFRVGGGGGGGVWLLVGEGGEGGIGGGGSCCGVSWGLWGRSSAKCGTKRTGGRGVCFGGRGVGWGGAGG